jgi:hypothetical protein
VGTGFGPPDISICFISAEEWPDYSLAKDLTNKLLQEESKKMKKLGRKNQKKNNIFSFQEHENKKFVSALQKKTF